VVTLADVLDRVSRPTPLQPDENYTTIGIRSRGGGIFLKAPVRGQGTSAKTLSRIEGGDIVYSRLFSWQGSFAVAEPEHEGAYASAEFPTFRARDGLLPEFFRVWASQPEIWDAAKLLCTGTTSGSRNRLKEEDFLSLEIQLPPLNEQRDIVLAAKNVEALAGAAAAEYEALRVLMRAGQRDVFEQLAGATTVVPLGEVASVRPGSTPARGRDDYFGGDVPWVKTGDIRYRDLHETTEMLTEAGLASCSAHLLPKGSVVLAMIGQGATRGRAAVLGRPMATNQNAAGIVPSDRLDGRYLFHWLWLNYEELRGDAAGTSQPALSARIVLALELPLPSVQRQREIAKRLDRIHRALNSAEDALAPIEALRASLVASLLAGERRIREFAAA
jgi:type I restriction enzyme S subunit